MNKINFDHPDLGRQMHLLCQQLFPICRSLTGQGVRETFSILQQKLPNLVTYEVPTGTACFDWTIPDEWNVKQAYIISPEGKIIADFSKNNLHLVGYSMPVNEQLSLQELDKHLHSLARCYSLHYFLLLGLLGFLPNPPRKATACRWLISGSD